MCDQIVIRIREDLSRSVTSSTPTMIPQVFTPPQESLDHAISSPNDIDDRNIFEDPAVQIADDLESNPSEVECDWERGLFLFNIARKYGLDWAVPGGPTLPTARSESARSGVVEVRDKVKLPEGTMYDLLKHLNVHLTLPHANEISPETNRVLEEAPKRIKPVPFKGINPIPMNAYSGCAGEALTFIDKQFLMPNVPNLPQVTYPQSVAASRSVMLSSVESVTALNILRDLPEDVDSEDYFRLLDHITSLIITTMKKTAEAFNSDIRGARARQLAGIEPNLRNELVNQPLIGSNLYTDYKKLLLNPIKPRGGRVPFRHPRAIRGGHTPRRPSWSPARSPARAYPAVPSTSATGWGAPTVPESAWNPEPYRGRAPRRPRGVRRGRR